MGASSRTWAFLLLGLLLTSFPGALGTNPGLVVRITDKGLEYGKKLWLSYHRLGWLTCLAHGCSGYGGGTDGALSLRDGWGTLRQGPMGPPPSGSVAFPARLPWLGLWPPRPAAWAHVLAGIPPTNREKDLGASS